PLTDDQLQLTGGQPGAIDPTTASRLITASPSLISRPPLHPWPAQTPRTEHWLRTDLPGLMPYVGAGADERDIRLWAWLAFLRHVAAADASGRDEMLILWNNTLPAAVDPSKPADPDELTWFYPGSWFGFDQP